VQIRTILLGRTLRPPPSGRAAATRGSDDGRRRWALVFGASTIVMLALRLKKCASINFFMPLVPLGVLVTGSLVARLGARLVDPLLLGQFLLTIYNPLRAVPEAADWQTGFALLARLQAVPGDHYLKVSGRGPTRA
jgi:hypothetical protein